MEVTRRLNNSYQKLYRNRHLFAGDLNLDDAEYRLMDLFIALYDWDKNHKETYQTVKATDRQIAKILSWSASKVCRTRNKLLKKGLIELIKRCVYKIVYLPYGDIAELKQQISPLQHNIATMKQKVAPMQQVSGYSNQNSIVSYKDKYSFIRNEGEYKEINKIVVNTGNLIENRWFNEDDKIQKLVRQHQYLAQLMLDYEIKNDLIPI